MSTYGVTAEGFVLKPTSVIREEFETGLKNGPLGASAGANPDGTIPEATAAGQLVALIVKPLAEQWELGQAAVAAQDPAQATDAAQDVICSLTGTIRRGRSFSTVSEICSGTPATVLPVGRVVKVLVTGARFASTEEQTIAALAAWVALTPYIVGDRVTNAALCFQCITAGTSAGSGGPAAVSLDITDGSVHWRIIGTGTGAVDVAFQAEAAGPIGALANTLTEIATPVDGWSEARNFLDATVGALKELDSALRIRREQEIQAQGNATQNAIRADVLQVGVGTNNPVLSCIVFANSTDATDSDGLPPHSYEVLVLGGEDADVALAIFNSGGAGIATHGTSSEVVTDDAGNPQTVYFTRPTEKTIWIIVNLTYNAAAFPVDLDAASDLINQALVDYGDTYPSGLDVWSSALYAPAFLAVAGVLGITSILIGFTDPPVASTTLTISIRELARFDTSRNTINLTPGTP